MLAWASLDRSLMGQTFDFFGMKKSCNGTFDTKRTFVGFVFTIFFATPLLLLPLPLLPFISLFLLLIGLWLKKKCLLCFYQCWEKLNGPNLWFFFCRKKSCKGTLGTKSTLARFFLAKNSTFPFLPLLLLLLPPPLLLFPLPFPSSFSSSSSSSSS